MINQPLLTVSSNLTHQNSTEMEALLEQSHGSDPTIPPADYRGYLLNIIPWEIRDEIYRYVLSEPNGGLLYGYKEYGTGHALFIGRCGARSLGDTNVLGRRWTAPNCQLVYYGHSYQVLHWRQASPWSDHCPLPSDQVLFEVFSHYCEHTSSVWACVEHSIKT